MDEVWVIVDDLSYVLRQWQDSSLLSIWLHDLTRELCHCHQTIRDKFILVFIM